VQNRAVSQDSWCLALAMYQVSQPLGHLASHVRSILSSASLLGVSTAAGEPLAESSPLECGLMHISFDRFTLRSSSNPMGNNWICLQMLFTKAAATFWN
jgi:hypothetical protein